MSLVSAQMMANLQSDRSMLAWVKERNQQTTLHEFLADSVEERERIIVAVQYYISVARQIQESEDFETLYCPFE